MEPLKPRKAGRPRKYQPNDKDRAIVIELAKCGYSVESIGRLLDVEVCPRTIQRHYEREIRTSRDQTVARMGQKLQQIALNGNKGAGDVNAINSWLNWFGRKPVREQEQDSGKLTWAEAVELLNED